MNMNIALGDRAKDPITGYQGIVVAETRWLFNCRRLTLQAEEMKDGKPVEPQTFDDQQLVLVSHNVYLGVAVEEAKTGGPMPAPLLHPNPTR